jgi:hypothetical protein
MDLAERLTLFRRDYPYRDITVRGTPWRYRMGGVPDGPTVLLLPGATMVPDPFFLVIEALGQRYRMIAAAYPPDKTMAALVEGVAAILYAEHDQLSMKFEDDTDDTAPTRTTAILCCTRTRG